MGFLFPALIFSLILISNAGLLFAESAPDAPQALVSEEMKDNPFGERKNLRAEVTAVNKEGMALLLKKDEAKKSEVEMWLPFGESARLSGYNSASDIQAGDIVVVTYEEDAEKSRRVLREVNFSERKAIAEEETPESDEPAPL